MISIDDNGGHVDIANKSIKKNSRFELTKIRAFRLEPIDFHTGAFDIDGESHPI